MIIIDLILYYSTMGMIIFSIKFSKFESMMHSTCIHRSNICKISKKDLWFIFYNELIIVLWWPKFLKW